MSRFALSGGVRPSRAVSLLAAAVGLGMVACVAAFFVSPFFAVGGFLLVWVVAATGIVAYHVWNAASSGGVPVARFGLEGSGPARSDQGERLRELERLRAEGLIDDAEYRAKRADIMAEDW